jgi:diadenylate cyclase
MDQGGVSGSVLGVRDQVTSLFFGFQSQQSFLVLLDIFLVAIILYYGYLLIRETRAIRILYGLVMLGVVYGLAQFLELSALLFLLRSIFAVILVAIPVVFQPELRAGLERIGRTRFIGSPALTGGHELREVVQALAQTLTVLSAKRIGALIVLEQHDSLREYSNTGVTIHGALSPELLLTIFRTGSPLHDGAVIVHGSTVEAASALLPVAGDRFDTSIGTRHRAAVGITQETDGIALVVSEETSRISIAHEGKLIRNVKPAQLETKLMELLAQPTFTSVSHAVRRLRHKR